MPATKPGDGRDTRRGRLYEPPRRAPAPPVEAGSSAAGTPTTTAPTTSPALQQARQRLKAEHERLRRLHKKLEGDLARHGDPERLALDGELLKTVMGRLERGADHVVVVDVDGAERTISLDPARDAKGNLQRLFDRARRARAAIAHARPRLDEVGARLGKVATLRDRLGHATVDDEAVVIADVDALLASPDSGPSARRKAALAGRRRPWRSFVVDGGVVVRVGRGAKDNDALVKSARGHDLWLHARDRTGAHVIIPSTGGPIPDATFVDAAHLAAWFSAGRGERHVDIQHTRVKHLKKPGAGAPAGLFLVGHEAVTHLRVDDERTKALLAREVAAG
jgi:predicted ribosome quality control (RQC) complex YloA/Tae2 family protein